MEICKIPQDLFVNQVIRKYRSYALIDIENKMQQLASIRTDNQFDEEYLSELRNLRSYYENVSVEELIIDFIHSANQRYEEEDMSYAKEAFDLLLSKKQFSSYH